MFKGGDPTYRKGTVFCGLFGQETNKASWMTAEARKEYGWGAYSDEPFTFGSLEKYVTSIGWFCDQVS